MKHLSKLDYLFGSKYQLWQYPFDEYLNYVTPISISNVVIRTARDVFGNLSDKIIWDMFSGIGTDSINFSNEAGKIICSEKNPETYQCLNANLEIFNINNVSTYLEDSSKSNHLSDIIYFDPPWGEKYVSGRDFSFDTVQINETENVVDLIKRLNQSYKMIIKAPISCNNLHELFLPNQILSIITFSQQKVQYFFINDKMSS